MQTTHTIRDAVLHLKKNVHPEFMSFLQQPHETMSMLRTGTQKDRYAAKTGDALNIVDQMQVLADTFAEDKQSAIDEENRLQKLYNDLMEEKTELLNSLLKEKAENEATLNQ